MYKYNQPVFLIYNDKKDIQPVNTRNNGAILDLDENSAVEVSSIITKQGAIPLTMGKLPVKVNGLIQQIKSFEKHGFKEVIFTGIHIGQWGKEWGKTILDLLKEVETHTNVRYRLGSLYPNEITDELLDFLSKSEQFCPHFHLSDAFCFCHHCCFSDCRAFFQSSVTRIQPGRFL